MFHASQRTILYTFLSSMYQARDPLLVLLFYLKHYLIHPCSDSLYKKNSEKNEKKEKKSFFQKKLHVKSTLLQILLQN